MIGLGVGVSAIAADGESTDFKNYKQKIPGTTAEFEMVPIPGGKITIGSFKDAPNRTPDELTPKEVEVKPFWMSKHEISWAEFLPWVFVDSSEVLKEGKDTGIVDNDGYSHPTKPYGSVYRNRGEKGYPAIGMSRLAAQAYCKWLSFKTGVRYRLPTEAEWEYACRAGSDTAFFWGDDPSKANEYAWYFDNAEDTTHQVGELKPNKFGLYDIAGNVAEWCKKEAEDSPNVVRGGSWYHEVEFLRSAARILQPPNDEWNYLDPQSPKSVWWLSAADFVGFRVVRTVEKEPIPEPQYKAGEEPAEAGEGKPVAEGKDNAAATYKSLCAGCHGTSGKGDTQLGKMLKARDYTDPEIQESLNDEEMFDAIKNGLEVDGRDVMHPYKDDLNDEQINALVDYMKSFGGGGAKIDASADYKRLCAGCHGESGKGDTQLGKMLKARDYSSEDVKSTLNDEEMFDAIKNGLKVNGRDVMHPYKDELNDEQINALVELMKSF
ncbi:MAG: SUMF1/EgtB/PvdO family nonheme iron enzyme [Verrucomicrobia bacterium]|nr:SUMF1/EgtB/PvdO family nonheme iron enzyme [Verrucomicrobiota bacterium]